MAKVTPDGVMAWEPIVEAILKYLKLLMKLFPAKKALTSDPKTLRQMAAVRRLIKELSA